MSKTKKGVALIGFGMVGGTYASALAELSDKVRLVGVLGRSVASGAAFLGKHPGLGGKAYATLDEVAGDPAVDFVILTTPPNARVEIVVVLARAGKPILMEKPVERTLAAASGIVATCRAAGVPLGIVVQHRASAPAKAMRARIAELGVLRAVEIWVPWWREQAYYDEPGRGTYARDGGGVMLTQAIHVMDLALQFTGPVLNVVALCATSGLHRMEAEDFVVAGLRFQNGAVGSLFATTASRPGHPEEIVLHYDSATVRGQRGSLQIDWADGRREVLGAAEASGAGADPMAFPASLHRDVIADFAECLKTGQEPLASGASVLPVHALIEAIERSGRSGARVLVETVDGWADRTRP